MRKQRRIAPRKMPLQQRAVFTVDAILEAATYILVREGWDRFTTNRIAERAGVNIASLYQYFPNKEAILRELQRRHAAKVHEGLPAALPSLQSQRRLRGVLKVILEAAVREHLVAPELHRAFAEELPLSARRHDAEDEELERRHWKALVEPFFKNVPDRELALFLCRVATHAAIHEAVSERPELLEHPLFVDEVATLLERYLRRPASARGTA